MTKNGKANKPLYIILAIAIACCLWFYVVSVENDDRESTITNIPITLVGEDVLNSSNLMVVGGRNSTVNLRVQTKRNTLARLSRENITIKVDVSKLGAAGEYSQAYEIIFPSNVQSSEVAVLDRSPVYVNLTLAKRVSKTIEIRGEFDGNVAKGFQKGEFVFNPASISISGQESDVNQVSHALITLHGENLDATLRQDMPFVLIGYNGNPLTGLNITCDSNMVDVMLPVSMVKELPLTVDFIPGGGATVDNIEYEIKPKTIVVSGDENDLAAYDEINLGEIDLAKVISSDNFTFTIPLGNELGNISGSTEATVSVKVNGLATKTLETDDIEIINTPDGMTATAVTQSIQVMVRGTQESLDLVLAQHIHVVVDLKDAALPSGQNIVTAKVTLLGGSGAGVVGDYKVAISLS